MAKVSFDSIFNKNTDGSIEPKQVIRIGGVTIAPGVKILGNVAIGGVDVTQLIDHELEITNEGDVAVITGIY